jgi:hypothetical protein
VLRTLSLLLAAVLVWPLELAASSSTNRDGVARSTRLTSDEQLELDAEIAALLDSPWEHTVTIRTAIGYRDNLLLSAFAPVGRGFAQAEIEGFAWRLPLSKWEMIAFLNGSIARFFSPPAETSGEQQWFGHGEFRWLPMKPLRLSLAGDIYYQDTVLDLSETQAVREVVPTRVHGALLGLGSRWDLPFGFSISPLVQVHRSLYHDFPGDYDEIKSGGRAEWKHAKGFAISAAYFERSRAYADRPAVTAGGRPLPGTQLHFHQHQGELKAADSWERFGRWSVAGTVSALENRDGASGYFDYREKRAELEIEWERTAWNVTLRGDAKRREYLVQTVGVGITPSRRVDDTLEVSARVARSWRKVWSVYLEERWERSRSNEEDFSYRANTSILGVQRVY